MSRQNAPQAGPLNSFASSYHFLRALSCNADLSARLASGALHRGVPHPRDEQSLQGKTQAESPTRNVHIGKLLGMGRHVQIRGKNGNEQCDQADTGGAAQTRNEQTDSAGDLTQAADNDQTMRRRKTWRDDALVERHAAEMIEARADERDSPDQAEEVLQGTGRIVHGQSYIRISVVDRSDER